MLGILNNIFKPKIAVTTLPLNKDIEIIGLKLEAAINTMFGRSLAIRVVDSGSDNATEIELSNLMTPHYDIERFGISFVASPRHADVIIITGAVTRNMASAVMKAYEAMPQPAWVVAVGDDACGIGIVQDSYAVLGAAEKVLPVNMQISGNPPTPLEILSGLVKLMGLIHQQKY